MATSWGTHDPERPRRHVSYPVALTAAAAGGGLVEFAVRRMSALQDLAAGWQSSRFLAVAAFAMLVAHLPLPRRLPLGTGPHRPRPARSELTRHLDERLRRR